MRSIRHASHRPSKLIVLGIGNTLMSDDGVGIHAVRNLQHAWADSAFADEHIEILDGGTLGFLLIDRVSDAHGLVIIDAANLGTAAGSVRVIDNEGIERYLEENPSSSVHEVGLIDLLQMMSLNDSQPRLRALVGIQPGLVDWGTDMSPPVAASMPAVRAAVENILVDWMGRAELCRN
jgi:hydrogenase maturation protease